MDLTDPTTLTPNESSSLGAQISLLGQDRVFGVWSGTRDDKALSFEGRMSTVNFDGVRTLINPFGKQLPGTVPDNIAGRSGALDELKRKRINAFVGVSGDAIFVEGWTFDRDTWIDVRYFLDWIRLDIAKQGQGLWDPARDRPSPV